jgi:hypothetical protein
MGYPFPFSICVSINQKKKHGGVMMARKEAKKEKGTKVKRPALAVETKRNHNHTPRTRGPRHIGIRWYTKEPFTNHKDSIVVGIDPGRCAPVYAYR